MVQVWSELDVTRGWADAFEGNAKWDEILGGYAASVDWPGGFFYKELMAAFPDARVLLSVRDGHAWARSMRETIWSVLYGDSMMADLSSARCRVDPAWSVYIDLMKAMWHETGLLEATSFDAEGVAKAMERYNKDVTATVPSDRLLIWSPSQGWDPLCEFLEVDVPPSPLPWVNDKEMFVDAIIDSSMATLTEWRAQNKPSAPE